MLVDSVIVIQERTSVYIVKQLVAKQRIIVMICCSCVVENGISVFVKDGLTVFSLLRFFHIYGSAEFVKRLCSLFARGKTLNVYNFRFKFRLGVRAV